VTLTPYTLSRDGSRPAPTSSRSYLRWFSAVAIALGGFSLTTAVFSGLGSIVFCTSFSTAVLSALLVSRCLRPHPKWSEMRENVSGRCVGWGSLVGALNALPSLLLTGLVEAGPAVAFSSIDLSDLGLGIFFAGLVGLIVGTPLGLFFSSIYVVVVRKAHALCVDGAIEGRDLLLRVSGLWLVGVAIGSFAFGMLIVSSDCESFWRAPTRGGHDLVMLLGCLPTLLFGFVSYVIGRRGLRRRKVWYEKVASGSVPGWSIVELSDIDDEAIDELAPLFHSPESEIAVLLREVEAPGNGAYRTGSEKIPWALVPTKNS